MTTYKKTLAALAIGLVGWGTQVVQSASAHITSGEWIGLATALLVSGGVYAIANEPTPNA